MEEDDDILGTPPPPQVTSCSGWQVTLGDGLSPCNKEIMEDGVVVCCSPMDKERTEIICQTLRREHQIRIDWFWIKGRQMVKTLDDVERVRSLWLQQIQHMVMERIKENSILERRAKSHTGKPDWEVSNVLAGVH